MFPYIHTFLKFLKEPPFYPLEKKTIKLGFIPLQKSRFCVTKSSNTFTINEATTTLGRGCCQLRVKKKDI